MPPNLLLGRGQNAELRASDADRDQAVARLRDHHVAGRLDLDEFTDRVHRALRSRTLGQLDLLFGDLPSATGFHLRRWRPSSVPRQPLQPSPLMWRLFPLHLYAYVVTCVGVVVSEGEQFVYPIVNDTLPDWVVLPMVGWGVGVAWHGLAVSWQRLRTRPNG